MSHAFDILIMKIIGGGLVTIVLFVVWVLRARRGRKIVAAIEEGKMCIRCDSTNVVLTEDQVKCLTCGFVDVLDVKRSKVDIDGVTMPK